LIWHHYIHFEAQRTGSQIVVVDLLCDVFGEGFCAAEFGAGEGLKVEVGGQLRRICGFGVVKLQGRRSTRVVVLLWREWCLSSSHS
jgi:hypothetical protein